ncbi:type IV toxin-antitoxin system AbiEi family antitoxin domain-containing protein [Hamadaea tsunoensis]|uniref:type IV toxin-antitoxin system AbiEi family antitoxin domain-containing protein n=1 Tax=Hamadaea tsunoensis TaxID=53368 RepID=UPI000420DD7F|nr:type IV toxin-antitoxin system AbiEi family antitoxin domain-containing protein [Hamadaea tsunoensis]
MDAVALRRLASRQQGLFTRGQARDLGFSAYQIRRRIQAGEWLVVAGAALAVAGLPVTERVRERAILLDLPGAVLAGPSAARRHGLSSADRRVFVAVGDVARPAPPGVVHLRDQVGPGDLTRHEGCPVTIAVRTVFDCLRVLPEHQALALLDEAVRAGLTTVDEVGERVHAHAGRRDAPRLARLMRSAGRGGRTAAERLLARLLSAAGIDGWTGQEPIFDQAGLIGPAGFAFPGARLIVEVDSHARHGSPGAFQRDRERQNRLAAAGWNVLRFTWADVVQRPAYVVAAVQGMLAGTGA